MTMVAVLSVFCALMTLVAASRLVVAETRDLVDVGSTLLVLAITAFSVLWAHFRLGFLPTPGSIAVLAFGIVAAFIGIAIVARGW